MADLDYGRQQEVVVKDWLLSQEVVSHAHDTLEGKEHLSRAQKIKLQHKFGDLRVTTRFGDVHYIEIKTDKSARKTGNLFLETYSDTGERTGNVREGWMLNRPKDCKITHYIFNLIGAKSVMVRKKDLEEFFDEHYKTGKYKEVAMSYDQQQMNRSKGVLIPIKDAVLGIKSCNFINIPNEVK